MYIIFDFSCYFLFVNRYTYILYQFIIFNLDRHECNFLELPLNIRDIYVSKFVSKVILFLVKLEKFVLLKSILNL